MISWRSGAAAASHYAMFILAGALAFITDAAVLTALIQFAGLDPLGARVLSIGAAMGVSWLLNRTLTFRVDASPGIGEFARFAGCSILAAALNYAIFAALLALLPGLGVLPAMTVSSLIAAVAAYGGMRFLVFGVSSGG